MNKRIHANIYIIISAALAYIYSIAIAPALFGVGETALSVNLTNFLNSVVINGIPTAIFILSGGRFGGKFRRIPGKTLLGLVCAVPVVWSCGNYLNSRICTLAGRFDILPIQQLPKSGETDAVIWGFIFVCIAAPLLEELFYRGVVLNLLEGYGKGCAVVVSALMFAFAHGSVTVLGVPLVYGVVFGYMTLKSGSIIPAIVMHVGANVLSWLLMTFEPGVAMAAVFNIIMIILGGVGIVWALVKVIKKKELILRTAAQMWIYLKNPLWLPILVNYIFTNIIYHG